jgi:hypothetical protein
LAGSASANPCAQAADVRRTRTIWGPTITMRS